MRIDGDEKHHYRLFNVQPAGNLLLAAIAGKFLTEDCLRRS